MAQVIALVLCWALQGPGFCTQQLGLVQGLPLQALERGLDLEGPAKGLAMELKEEPDWEAEQVPRRNRKSWADLAAEEKKEPAKKDGKHEQKNEWWEEDWKKGGKKWDDWWEEKEEQWQAWSKNKRWEPDGEDTEEEEVPSSSTQKKNKCGSQKERAKRRWLMKTCKNESQEEKEKLKLGALRACRLKRLLDRQEDRKNKLEAAQLAQAAAGNAAAAAQAAQAAAASAQWQQWQMQQAQLVEAQAMWHHHAYYQGQGGQPHQWGWHHQTMEQPVEQPKQPKPHRHQPGLVCYILDFLQPYSFPHVCWLCLCGITGPVATGSAAAGAGAKGGGGPPQHPNTSI